jgi:AraC-like DNA-binding protein
MDIELTIKKFYEATKIPLQLYDVKSQIAAYDIDLFKPNPANIILEAALESGQELCYTYSPEYLFCGLIRISESTKYIILGPVLSSECSRKQAQSILSRFRQPMERLNDFILWLRMIPQYDIQRFQGCLKLLDYSLNQREQTELVNIPYQESTSDIPIYETAPSFIDHIDDSIETEILSCIEYGRLSSLEKIMVDFTGQSSDGIPKVTDSVIRSFKTIFIFSTALASRSAIRGGLDYDTAMALTTNYINQIEKFDNYTDIFLFLKQMFLDFARRVSKVRSFSSNSQLVSKISKDINAHIYEKITPTLISEHLNMNCTYLCAHFKKETGKTITAYIHELKIKECKRLLATTQMPIIQISTQLGFSSQNYFHTVFKKITGMTPVEFRSQSLH